MIFISRVVSLILSSLRLLSAIMMVLIFRVRVVFLFLLDMLDLLVSTVLSGLLLMCYILHLLASRSKGISSDFKDIEVKYSDLRVLFWNLKPQKFTTCSLKIGDDLQSLICSNHQTEMTHSNSFEVEFTCLDNQNQSNSNSLSVSGLEKTKSNHWWSYNHDEMKPTGNSVLDSSPAPISTELISYNNKPPLFINERLRKDTKPNLDSLHSKITMLDDIKHHRFPLKYMAHKSKSEKSYNI